MNTSEELASLNQHLRRLDLRHCEDGDGGYALVHEIRSWRESLGSERQQLLDQLLLDLVTRKDEQLWGVALEVLVQEMVRSAVPALRRLAVNIDNAHDWRDQLVLALLRLRDQEASDFFSDYIRRSLQRHDTSALPLLAALCQVDERSCISLSSQHFARLLALEDNMSRIEGYIPAFVRNLVAVRADLLKELVAETTAQNKIAGQRLASLIQDYFSKPWIRQELGDYRSLV